MRPRLKILWMLATSSWPAQNIDNIEVNGKIITPQHKKWYVLKNIMSSNIKNLQLEDVVPRLSGFSIDDGTPARGTRYGGTDTIHNTGTIDIQVDEEGQVQYVWFRCKNLAWNVSEVNTGKLLSSGNGSHVAAIEIV